MRGDVICIDDVERHLRELTQLTIQCVASLNGTNFLKLVILICCCTCFLASFLKYYKRSNSAFKLSNMTYLRVSNLHGLPVNVFFLSVEWPVLKWYLGIVVFDVNKVLIVRREEMSIL